MAADGTLRFDTSLDPEGFQRGTEKLNRAMEGFANSVERSGGRIKESLISAFSITGRSMDEGVFQKYADSMQADVAKAVTEFTKYKNAFTEGLSKETDFKKQISGMQELQYFIDSLQKRVSSFGKANVISKESEEIEKQIDAKSVELKKATDRYETAKSAYEKAQANNAEDVERYRVEMVRAAAALKPIEKSYDALIEKQMKLPGGGAVTINETKEYDRLRTALTLLIEEYNKLGVATTEAFNNFQSQNSADLLDQSGITKGTEAVKSASQQNQQARRQLAEVAVQTSNQEKQADTERASIAQSTAAIIGAAMSGIKSAFTGISSAISTVIPYITKFASTIARVPFQAMSAGAKGIATAFRTIGSAIKNAISYFASFRNQGKGVGDLAGELVGRLDSVKRMLVSRVKRMFISSIMKDMQAAMSALAQKSSEFQSALNGMQTAASGLSANLASLFGGIITALAPVVTQIISWISTIISYINALFGLLSGKGTIMTAKKGIDSLGSSAGGGSKKVKELKKELMGFDEINNLKDDEDSGGGGGGSGAGDLFEETSIDDYLPENIRDYFQRIKDAILSENWEEVGGLVADGLNYAMRKIDDAILQFQSVGVKWANIIARVMNGLVARFDFPLLGKTIGDGFNTIIMIENEFLETFEFIAFGAGLGDTINAMFATIDWTALGRNFALKINAFTAVVDGFLKNFKAKTAGADLGTMVNSMFDGIVWTGEGGIADTFSDGVNAVIEALDGFISEVEKGGAERRQQFADAIQQAITGVNWVQAIVTLNQGFKLISLWLSVAFEGLAKGIEDSAPAIVTALNGVIKEENFTPIADSIGNGIKSLVTAFDKITNPQEGIDFEGLGNKIAEGINVIIGKVDFSQLIVAIGNGIIGVSKMFWGFLSLINFDKIATDLLNGINTLITDTSFKDVIEKATQGVNNVIDAFAKLVGTGEGGEGGIKFSDLATKITEGINQIATDIKFDELITTVGTGVGKVFVALAEGFSKVRFDTIARHIARGINGIAHNKEIDWGKFGQDLGTGLANAIRSMTTFVTETDWQTVGTNIGTAIAKIPWGEIAGALWDLFKAAIIAAFDISGAIAEAMGYVSLDSVADSRITQYFAGQGIAVSAAFADGMKDALPQELEGVASMMTFYGKTSIEGMDEAAILALHDAMMAGEIDSYYSNMAGDVVEIAQQAGIEVGSTMTEATGTGMVEGMEKASESVEGEAQQLGEVAGMTAQKAGIEASAKDAGAGAGDGAAEGVAESQESATTASQGLGDSMMQAIQFAIDAGTPQAEQAVQTAAEAVVGKAAEIMSSAKGQEIASTFMGGITSGIQSQQGMIYSNMATVGTYITAGMAHGIYSSTSVVTNAAVNAAIAAYNAACRVLGIASPSKLFAEIGKFTMMGWAKGEEENQDAVLDTISNTAKAMEEEAQDTEFNVSADALVNGLDIAMDRLQSIADVFSSIGNMIADIGQLPIPAIATGSVIPYRTRISDGFTDNETSLPSNVLTVDNGYDVMYRAFRSALLDTADDRPIELSINGKKLADWVQKQNRIDSRARGV